MNKNRQRLLKGSDKVRGKVDGRSPEIFGFITGFPFDVAADAGLLGEGGGFAGEDGIQS